MISSVGFFGITGMVGKPVAQALLKAGFEVCALTRSPEKVNSDQRLTLIKGDLKSDADVEKVVAGRDAIYVSLSVDQNERENDWHTETDGMKNILATARRHNIKRIILLSSLVQRYQGMNGFHWWVFAVKEDCIRLIRESGIPYTIFYPSTFMESFLGKYRQGSSIVIVGKSKSPMYYIAGSDYARQVVASLQRNPADNKEYVVQGPEALTQEEAAKLFTRNYHKASLKIVSAPLALLKLVSPFSRQINYGAHIVEALTHYPEKFESETTWHDLGRPQVTLKEFAERSE